jgi:hypothetical protein
VDDYALLILDRQMELFTNSQCTIYGVVVWEDAVNWADCVEVFYSGGRGGQTHSGIFRTIELASGEGGSGRPVN